MNHPTSRGVFYRNYDLYDTGGEGPGSGLYSNLDKYKSISEFRKAKEKRKKNRKDRENKLASKINIFVKLADFPLDNQNISLIQDPNRDRSMDGFLSGINSGYEKVVEPSANLPNPTVPWINNRINNENDSSMEDKIEQVFSPAEPGLFGESPSEITPNSDVDHLYDSPNSYYGNSNIGNLSYPAHIL